MWSGLAQSSLSSVSPGNRPRDFDLPKNVHIRGETDGQSPHKYPRLASGLSSTTSLHCSHVSLGAPAGSLYGTPFEEPSPFPQQRRIAGSPVPGPLGLIPFCPGPWAQLLISLPCACVPCTCGIVKPLIGVPYFSFTHHCLVPLGDTACLLP